MTTLIYTNGKVIGTVEDGEFRKSVQRSKHMLRKPPAWCLSIESLDQAEAAGARVVILNETESGAVYSASLESVNRYGQRLERGDFEPQIRLDLRYWTCTPRPAAPDLRPKPQDALPVRPLQLF